MQSPKTEMQLVDEKMVHAYSHEELGITAFDRTKKNRSQQRFTKFTLKKDQAIRGLKDLTILKVDNRIETSPTKAKETLRVRCRQYYPVGTLRERAYDAQTSLSL